MLYLVDGYNVTRRDPATAHLPLREQREALGARLQVRGRDLLGVGRTVIVFDGQGGPGLSAERVGGIEIVYAHKHSADDEIVRIASQAQTPVVVVTSDRAVGERAAQSATVKVDVRDASVCFEGVRSGKHARAKRRARGSIARDEGLPRGASKITRELKDLWLSEEDS